MTCLTCDRKLWSFERERGTCGRCALRRGNARRASLIATAKARLEKRRRLDAARELVAQAQAHATEAAALEARRARYRTRPEPAESTLAREVEVPVHGRGGASWLFGGGR